MLSGTKCPRAVWAAGVVAFSTVRIPHPQCSLHSDPQSTQKARVLRKPG